MDTLCFIIHKLFCTGERRRRNVGNVSGLCGAVFNHSWWRLLFEMNAEHEGQGPGSLQEAPSLRSRAKPWDSLGWEVKGTTKGGSRAARQVWFRGRMFGDLLVFCDPGTEISRPCADLNLFNSKEVVLVKKEHLSSVRLAPSLLLQSPLSFLSHSLLFACVPSWISRKVFLFSLVFFDASLCFSSSPLSLPIITFLLHRDQRGGLGVLSTPCDDKREGHTRRETLRCWVLHKVVTGYGESPFATLQILTLDLTVKR